MPVMDYSEEIAGLICDEIMSGLYLPTICKKPGFPARSTVYKWLGTIPEFEAKYNAACRARAYADADECEEIASGRHRYRDLKPDEEGKVPDHNPILDDDTWVKRDKLMLYNKEKQMAWSNPTRYGAVKVDLSFYERPPAKVIELHDDPGQVDPVGEEDG